MIPGDRHVPPGDFRCERRSLAFRVSRWIGFGIFLMLEFVVLFLLAFTAKEIWSWLW